MNFHLFLSSLRFFFCACQFYEKNNLSQVTLPEMEITGKKDSIPF